MPEHVIFFQIYGFIWFATKISVMLHVRTDGRIDRTALCLPHSILSSATRQSASKKRTALIPSPARGSSPWPSLARRHRIRSHPALLCAPLPAPRRTARPPAPLCHATAHSGVPPSSSPTAHPTPHLRPLPRHAVLRPPPLHCANL